MRSCSGAPCLLAFATVASKITIPHAPTVEHLAGQTSYWPFWVVVGVLVAVLLIALAARYQRRT